MKIWLVLLLTGLIVGCVPRSRYQRDISIAKTNCTADLDKINDRYVAAVKENDALKTDLAKANDRLRRYDAIFNQASQAVKTARTDK